MTIRYPSILDMTDELNQLNDIIEKIEHVHIIEITHSLITISDKYEEYEYDSILEAIKEWKIVLAKNNSELII